MKLRKIRACLLSIMFAGCVFSLPSLRADEAAPDESPYDLSPVLYQADYVDAVMPVIDPYPDPIEPFNRGSFAFNDFLMEYLIIPAERGYMFVAPEEFRKRVKKFGINLAYPVRLVNTLLQGEFHGSLDETNRFLINTTVGLLGFFDPASTWGIEKHDEDFGQTFGEWGSGPGFYFVLPVLGPSSGRDAGGEIGNAAFNPATYVPGLSAFFGFNNLSYRIDQYENLKKSDNDPYVPMKYVYEHMRIAKVRDFDLEQVEVESNPDPSFGALFVEVENPEFLDKLEEKKVYLENTGDKLPYTLYLNRDGRAPIVYILPGVGVHRTSGRSEAMAELLGRHGCSVAIISSAMNWEFIRHAGSTALPGNTPVDAHDVYDVILAIHAQLKEKYPDRVGRPSILGLSLGALHALFIADIAENDFAHPMNFEHYVALNPPVDIFHALKRLDEYFMAPAQWPDDEMIPRIETLMMKAAVSAENPPRQLSDLPFDEVESQFLIGLSFRYILSKVIFQTQKENNLGILDTPFRSGRRTDLYREIYQYAYADYGQYFLLPYYRERWDVAVTIDEIVESMKLKAVESALRENPKIRVLHNADDFLLRENDKAWLSETLGTRLTLFPKGGHLGNLHTEQFQNKLMEVFELEDIRDSEADQAAQKASTPSE